MAGRLPESLIVFFVIKIVHGFLMSQSGRVIPKNYEIFLNFNGTKNCPDDNCFYRGEVNITMNITGRDDIFLLQSDPKIIIDETNSRLYRINPNETLTQMKIINFIYEHGSVSSTIEIRVEQMFRLLASYQYILQIFFTREFSDHRGFYDSMPEIHANRILIVSLMGPQHPEKIFPYINEQLKWRSTFTFTIIYPSEYKIMTGMDTKLQENITSDLAMTIFSSVKTIPYYHVFFAIWSYEFSKLGPFTFWHRPEINANTLRVMVLYTVEGFKTMVKLTNITIPLQSMNIAIFPGTKLIDFYIAPHVTLFREEHVILDKIESTTSEKLNTLMKVGRAITRHWIGTMIYPRDWSDYWMYRALANYVADFIIDQIEPSFRSFDHALERTLLWTRSDRVLNASSTLPFYLFDTWDDWMHFRKEDYTNYQVVTIVAMIHEIYGFHNVSELTVQFIARWYRSDFGPTPQELIAEFKDKTVEKMAEEWFENPGTPVIHMALNGNQDKVELVQERFNSFGPWSESKYLWTIPIRCFNFLSNRFYHEWLIPNKTFIGDSNTLKACFLATDSVVPYRLNFPEQWWYEIIETLETDLVNINEMQRMRIIDDLVELCYAGYIHMDIAFRLLKYLKHEKAYFPWVAAGKVLQKMRGVLALTTKPEYKARYKRFVVDLVSEAYAAVKITAVTKEDDISRMHRKNIVNIACGFGHEECLREAEEKLKCFVDQVTDENCPDGHCFKRWKKCASNADTRELILCQGLRRADQNLWHRVFKLLNLKNLFFATKSVISRSLVCVEDEHILENFLHFVLYDENLIPGNNVFPILLSAARLNEDHAKTVLYFVIKNHDKLMQRMQMPHEYHPYVDDLADDIYETEEMKKPLKYDKILSFSELPESVKLVIDLNTRRANRIKPLIEAYLNKTLTSKKNY